MGGNFTDQQAHPYNDAADRMTWQTGNLLRVSGDGGVVKKNEAESFTAAYS